MSVWDILSEALRGHIREERKYRGETALRLKDLGELMKEINGEHGPGSEPRVLDPEGGVVRCLGDGYSFSPAIWGKWYPSIDPALTMASTDKGQTGQHPGVPQGGTVMKRNYGGRVVYQPGKARNDFERLPSAMDRYDVLMVGEVSQRTNKKKQLVEFGLLSRFAYSPAIGSAEERRARLRALLAGQAAPGLKRRPQPEVPGPGKDDDTEGPPAQPVPRVGQNIRKPKADED